MMHTRKARRGTILALALVLLVVLSLFGLAIIQLAQFSNTREHIQYRRSQAQWRVKGATEYAVWQLCSTDVGTENSVLEAPDYTYGWGADGAYLDYPLTDRTTADASVVDIDVSADPVDPTMRAIRAETRVMEKVAVARHVIDTSPPHPGLGYAILSDDCLTLNGNVAVQSNPDAAPEVWNADIHGNGSLVQVWGSATVAGFATSAGDAIIKDGSVAPPLNPYGLPAYATYRDAVPVPDIDPASLRDSADLILAPTDIPAAPKEGLVLDYGGTEDDPTIVFIDGDWRPKGDYTFVNNVVLVVNGAFEPVSGGFVFGAGEGGHMSIIANTIDIEGNAKVSAWLYGRNACSFDGRGGAILNGSITTKGAISLLGTVDINYPRADEDFFPVSGAPKRLCYQTRSGGQTW